jgi:acyl-CoA thioesterase-1
MVAELGRDAESARGSEPEVSKGAVASPVDRAADPPGPPGSARTPASGELPRVVFLGDSLTAGLGLGEGDAWPAKVTAALAAEGLPIRAVNAGVSGDTSAGGLSRVDWILRLEPDVVVVELGPNDGLRGLPLEATEGNLREIVRRIEAAGARVLLVGMRIPPNYGPDYAGGFRDLYPRLAAELGVPLVPFLLEGVGGEPDLNLPDGIHPNAAGHRVVAETVLPHLRPLVAEAAEDAG